MSDNVEVNDDGAGNEPEPKQLSAIEQKAAEQGWRPQDEWDGEPDQWRSAKEFLDRGEFFKKIDEQNRTIKELRKTQADFAKHYERMKKVEFERALEVLKAQKKEALLEQDVDAVMEIEEKMADVREQSRNIEVPQVNVEPELNPIFVAWKDRNSWYESDRAMRAFADTIGTQMHGASPTDILAEVERQVKKEFAHKFQNPNRQKAPPVEGGTNKGPAKRDTFTLTDEERRVMQRLVRNEVLTEDEYIKQLKEAKSRGL